jgi:transposase
MKTYSPDFRDRALALIERGRTVAEVAALLGVGEATLKRWRRLRRETGSTAPRPKSGRPPTIDPARHPDLVAQVEAAPDATLAEHCRTWEREQGARVSEATMSRALARLGWPLKKSRPSPPSATRPSAPPGARLPRGSTAAASSSSTRAAPTPR